MDNVTDQLSNWTTPTHPDTFLSPVLHKDLNHHITLTITVAIVLGVLILATVLGNVLVLTAIVRDRNLQTVSNYLVFSLAVADLLVACLVMPPGAQYEVMDHHWTLGADLCELWTFVDVLCCTASILHLVAIALDRYKSVTSVSYAQRRNGRKLAVMVAFVWGISFVVSFAPILGWKDDQFSHRVQEEKRCLVSQDVGYQIFATCATFYVPLVIILILYWKIYKIAKRRIRCRPGQVAIRPATLLPLGAEGNMIDFSSFNGSTKTSSSTTSKKRPRESTESRRDTKAGKTLVIITGAFVVCWLPFFVMALLMALCDTCHPRQSLFSLFLWLGYFNSTLNPLLYTVFSPDFRKAFTKLLWRKR